MEDYTLGVVESHFADICWSNTPIATNKLVKLCEEQLDWKRTTTYTVLKSLLKKESLKIRRERLRPWFRKKIFMQGKVSSI